MQLRLDHSGDTELESLPDGLSVGTLVLRGCTALRRLPRGLTVTFLDLSECVCLEELPDDLRVAVGRLDLRGCKRLTSLPAGIGPLSQLDVADCEALQSLPDGLVVTSWVDVGGSGLRSLPSSMRRATIRWRGVTIDERIAFRPETLIATEALTDLNAERRRVRIERMGFDRFMTDAGASVLDADHDTGGERKLLRVDLEGDEALVCLSVRCPSTGRQYLLRVPPQMATCRRAAAWLAGFDRAEDYEPVLET
jgi:hypothetical protein